MIIERFIILKYAKIKASRKADNVCKNEENAIVNAKTTDKKNQSFQSFIA